MENAKSGTSAGRTLPAGRFITSRIERGSNRIYASQTSGWFGQIIQRSDDGGKTWIQPGTPPGEAKTAHGPPKGDSNKFVYDTSPETGSRSPLTSGMTARSTPGSSSASGISSPL